MSDLETRVKTLEDTLQRITQALIAAPTPTAKPMQAAPAAEGTVCPKCGGKKKPDFKLCYKCHEAEKA